MSQNKPSDQVWPQAFSTGTPGTVIYSLAIAPVAWLALFAAFVVRARLELGAWPFPAQPDPKSLGFDVHYGALLVGLPVTFFAVICLVAATLVHFRSRLCWVSSAAALAGLATIVILSRLDPGYLFTWFAD